MKMIKIEKLRVFTSFSGYDSQCLALDRLGIDYDLVGWSEIDRYAIQAHNALYPQYAERNYGDISKIDWDTVPDFDLFTYSSPCQDFSRAGLQRGGEQGSGTRSSLLWECERAIRAKRPKYLLMENVAALVSGKFIKLFNKWQRTLEGYGYRNFAKVLNAKDYGVPQNRERIFVVSIHDESARFYFPQPIPLKKRLKDVLEPVVDEKYYINDIQVQKVLNSSFAQERNRLQDGKIVNRHPVEVANCVTAAKRDNTQNYVVEREVLNASSDGCATTLTTAHHYSGNIIDPKRGQKEMGVLEILNPDKDGNGYVRTAIKEGISVHPLSHKLEYKGDKSVNDTVSPALRATDYKAPLCYHNKFRIRKLTNRECFRLMGVDDADIDKIQTAGISNSQQYKLAGNSIVVDVLAAIFRKMLVDKANESPQLTLF